MRVAVIAAHPDDEVLALGGTIARHVAKGDEVFVKFFSDGVTGRDFVYDPALRKDGIDERKNSAGDAAAILGISYISFLDYPNLRMDQEPILEITKHIEYFINECEAQCVYTHHSSDTNIDHQVCFRATIIACRPVPKSRVTSIRTFEVPSSTEYSTHGMGPNFEPNLFVDIEQYWEKKIEAVNCYGSEIRKYPFPRSVEYLDALARFRGASVGLHKAEAFFEVRRIEAG